MSDLIKLNEELEKAESESNESRVYEIEQMIDHLTSQMYGDL